MLKYGKGSSNTAKAFGHNGGYIFLLDTHNE